MDIVERLRFDAARCEVHFSKGVADNIEEAANEIERLRRDCAELYQVIGTMAEHCPDDPAIVKAQDNARAAANGTPRPHDDLMPFFLRERQW